VIISLQRVGSILLQAAVHGINHQMIQKYAAKNRAHDVIVYKVKIKKTKKNTVD
jgi:hypothetical protein